MADAEQKACDVVNLLPCPACGNTEIACRAVTYSTAIPFVCLRCGAVSFSEESGMRSGWRDGALAWNAWVRRARSVRKEGR